MWLVLVEPKGLRKLKNLEISLNRHHWALVLDMSLARTIKKIMKYNQRAHKIYEKIFSTF